MNRGTSRSCCSLYGIKATKIRISEKQTVRGYRCEDFDDAWRCFLPA